MKSIIIKYGGIVGSDTCDFYNVYCIDIIEDEKILQLFCENGYLIGQIHYENEKEVTFNSYNENDEICDKITDIIKNGKVVYKR